MELHLDRLESVAADLGDALAIAQRALERVHQEIADARARAAGQADLPLAAGLMASASGLSPAPQEIVLGADGLPLCACGHERGYHNAPDLHCICHKCSCQHYTPAKRED